MKTNTKAIQFALIALIIGVIGAACTMKALDVNGSGYAVEVSVSKPVAEVTAAPAPAPPAKEVAAAPSGFVPVLMEPIYFDFDKADIRADASLQLLALIKGIEKSPDAEIVIYGHADDRGSNEYNEALGMRRALSVKAYIEELDIPHGPISLFSCGEEMPVCVADTTEPCRQMNRRAEFIILE